MEEAEQVEIKVVESQKELKQTEQEQARSKQELTKEMEEISASLDELKKKRQLMMGGIDKNTLRLYCLLKDQKQTAVVRLERGSCRGCGIAVTSAWQQRARGGEMVKCSNCGRILYIGN
jgi:predicted  nucleic acid-binding Zn-ribbon protein